MRKKLIIGIDGGLVNKLLAYLSAKVISCYLDRDLYVYWTPHLGGLCESLLILFDDESIKTISYKEFQEYCNSEQYVFSKEAFTNIQDHIFLKSDNVVIEVFYLTLKPKFIADDIFLSQMRQFWKNLKIKKDILDRVPIIQKNTITLHVRRHHANINIPIKKYENIIESELKNDSSVKFFITTDNMEDKIHILSKYPDKTVSNNIKNYWNTRGDQGVIEAFIDVLSINQTKKIYTPSGSTFTYLSRYGSEDIRTIMIQNEQDK